jgi:hypothetical protein
MDEQTLAHHDKFVVDASPTGSKEGLRLARDEMILYERLVVTGRLLEQERIHDGYSGTCLRRLIV